LVWVTDVALQTLLFWLRLTCKYNRQKKSLNYRSFTKLFLCDIQNLKTISCDRAFETEKRPEISDARNNTLKKQAKQILQKFNMGSSTPIKKAIAHHIQIQDEEEDMRRRNTGAMGKELRYVQMTG